MSKLAQPDVLRYLQIKTRSVYMLVLNRCVGESIIIDNNIHVKIISLQGGQVRLGIEAPRNIQVHREEIFQRIQSQQKADEVKNINNAA